MKKIKIIIIVLATINIYSQRQNSIFSIFPDDKRFNSTFLINNTFDSAMVFYEVGNIFYCDENQHKHKVYLSDSLDKLPNRFHQASGTLGESVELFQILRTETFHLPGNALQFEFFRYSLLRKDPCSAFSSSESSGESSGIDDLSKFKIDVIDAATNMVLSTIDSIISEPVNHRNFGNLIGTSPELTYHLRPIPQNCKNKNVYLR